MTEKLNFLEWDTHHSGYLPERTIRHIIENPEGKDSGLVDSCNKWVKHQDRRAIHDALPNGTRMTAYYGCSDKNVAKSGGSWWIQDTWTPIEIDPQYNWYITTLSVDFLRGFNCP